LVRNTPHSRRGCNLAWSSNQKTLAEAETIQRDEVERARKAMGPNIRIPDCDGNLAITCAMEKKLDESEKLFREALEIETATWVRRTRHLRDYGISPQRSL